MVPGRERRRTKLERGVMRVVATGGIIGIAVALGAVLVAQDVAGWIVGLVIGLTSVIVARPPLVVAAAQGDGSRLISAAVSRDGPRSAGL
jgi:hypothetical protein